MYAHLQKDALNPIIEPKYWMLNTSRLHFARDFFFLIVVERVELTDENDELTAINRCDCEIEFSDADLKQIVFSLGSEYDQTNFDIYHFIVRSELIAGNYEYFIELIN